MEETNPHKAGWFLNHEKRGSCITIFMAAQRLKTPVYLAPKRKDPEEL